MTQGLTIGDFSRITHLSVKTLHHYHQVGLLEPARVSRETGYRYYSPDQVPTAQVIRRLRDLEMPVGEVKAVLDAADSDSRNVLIARHLGRLEVELAQTHAAVDSLRSLLEHPPRSGRAEHRIVPSMAAAGITATVDRADMAAWWQGALGELQATVAAQGLRPVGPSGGLFASAIFQLEGGEATVFVPVDGPVHAVGRVEPIVVPGAELAVMTHHGSLADIDLTYADLGTYATDHEISVDGPLRETYLHGPFDHPAAAGWEIELGWPIFALTGGPSPQRPH